MCGAVAWALSASKLSHFSIARKVSAPYLVWIAGAWSASMAGPYSMQPCSAWTAGMLARNSFRIAARWWGLAGMTAMTWVMAGGSRVARLVPRGLCLVGPPRRVAQ